LGRKGAEKEFDVCCFLFQAAPLFFPVLFSLVTLCLSSLTFLAFIVLHLHGVFVFLGARGIGEGGVENLGGGGFMNSAGKIDAKKQNGEGGVGDANRERDGGQGNTCCSITVCVLRLLCSALVDG
jgi:hypothetical protein